MAESTQMQQAEVSEARIEALTGALQKISAIRDSIVGCQRVNWSEHIYPLVAALGEAGFEGQPYAEARANVGTLIERINTAESQLAQVIHGIGDLLSDNGCDCECGHDWEGHDDECDRCLACRVNAVLNEAKAK